MAPISTTTLASHFSTGLQTSITPYYNSRGLTVPTITAEPAKVNEPKVTRKDDQTVCVGLPESILEQLSLQLQECQKHHHTVTEIITKPFQAITTSVSTKTVTATKTAEPSSDSSSSGGKQSWAKRNSDEISAAGTIGQLIFGSVTAVSAAAAAKQYLGSMKTTVEENVEEASTEEKKGRIQQATDAVMGNPIAKGILDGCLKVCQALHLAKPAKNIEINEEEHNRREAQSSGSGDEGKGKKGPDKGKKPVVPGPSTGDSRPSSQGGSEHELKDMGDHESRLHKVEHAFGKPLRSMTSSSETSAGSGKKLPIKRKPTHNFDSSSDS
ncbi:MAG: hypothetical protein Q9159_007699 [Coniocarpon cinnabarinum]